MTIDEFMDSFNINKKSIVLKWLESNLIPGSYKNGEWVIMNLARPPYTRARAKNASSIYISIVKACNMRKGVCAKLYKITEEEFDVYIAELMKAGLIITKKECETNYYFATPKSESFIKDDKGLKKYINSICKTVIVAISEGVVKATLGKI